MNSDNEWKEILKGHPIFALPKPPRGSTELQSFLELSTSTLPRFVNVDPLDDGPTPSGRRQTMVLKDADLILAAGREIRVTSLGDTKFGQNTRKSFKVCETLPISPCVHSPQQYTRTDTSYTRHSV